MLDLTIDPLQYMVNYDAIILANGEFPHSIELLEILNSDRPIICCDGAVNQLLKCGIYPSVVVGDLDSIDTKLKADLVDVLIADNNQNYNDLTKALNFCIKNQYQKIVVLGATGKREDHMLGNIGLLNDYATYFSTLSFITDYGIFIPIARSCEIKTQIGQQVSIFSFSDALITSEGLRYPLQTMQLPYLYSGTLNQAMQDKIYLQLHKGNILVYLVKVDAM